MEARRAERPDYRIGGAPANGCHPAFGTRYFVVVTSRDRAQISLRGIGDAVRAAVASRGLDVPPGSLGCRHEF